MSEPIECTCHALFLRSFERYFNSCVKGAASIVYVYMLDGDRVGGEVGDIVGR